MHGSNRKLRQRYNVEYLIVEGRIILNGKDKAGARGDTGG
jgi:hypothetical protein